MHLSQQLNWQQPLILRLLAGTRSSFAGDHIKLDALLLHLSQQPNCQRPLILSRLLHALIAAVQVITSGWMPCCCVLANS